MKFSTLTAFMLMTHACTDVLSMTDQCMDTLKDTESHFKDCSTLIQAVPCGSVISCCGIAVDEVCAKTCGLCDKFPNGDRVADEAEKVLSYTRNLNTAPPKYRRLASDEEAHVVRVPATFNPEEEYTEFNITNDAVYITSRVPRETSWFGYQMYTFTITPGTGNNFMYVFQVQQDGTVKAQIYELSYLGGILPMFANRGLVFECTAEDEMITNGQVCEFDEETGKGDFMLKAASILLGARLQPEDSGDIDIVETSIEEDYISVLWKRALTPPFDGDTLLLRYASKPLEYESTVYESIHNVPYHGVGARFSSDPVPLKPLAVEDDWVIDGVLQHEIIPGTGTIVVGGKVGWNNPPSSVIKHDDLTVEPGTVLMFAYTGFSQVIEYDTAEDMEACNIDKGTKIADSFDSPFKLQLNETGRYFFSSSSFLCGRGVKLSVAVDKQDVPLDEMDEKSGSFRPTMTFLLCLLAVAISITTFL